MKLDTVFHAITVLITIALGITLAYNTPAPLTLEDRIPGWMFWGIGFVLFLRSIARAGIRDSQEEDRAHDIRLNIGMSEDE